MKGDLKDTDLHIDLKGINLIRRAPSTLKTARRRNDHLFDPASIEAETEVFDLNQPSGEEGSALLSTQSPSLLAIRNKVAKRAKTTVKTARGKSREVEIFTPRNTPSMLVKQAPRPKTSLTERTAAFTERISRDTEAEKISLEFDDDPVSYFSKRKDGRGHRFIFLNYAGSRDDPLFNPYDLEKVPYALIDQEYFTMSASGVSHLYNDGTTESIPIDRWVAEKSRFESVRKLKFFSQYFYWKPFAIWVKFVKRRQFVRLMNKVINHGYFNYQGFYSTKFAISNIFMDDKGHRRVEDLVKRLILSFNPQQRYPLREFKLTSKENIELFKEKYVEYISKVEHEMRVLDAKIRDPRVVQVKDSDFPEIKLRNPNLKKLKLLEEKKANRRIQLTKKVNSQIIQFGFFVRDIDYMLLENLAISANECWANSLSNVIQPMSSVFNVEISFGDSGEVLMKPTLDELTDAIRSEFKKARETLNGLPRIILLDAFKPHLIESNGSYEELKRKMPILSHMLKRYTDMDKAENQIIESVTKSYHDAEITSNDFLRFYNVYNLGMKWSFNDFIETRSGNPPAWKIGDKNIEVQASEINFDNEPIIDIKRITELLLELEAEEEKLSSFTPATVRGAIYIDSKGLRQILNPIPLNLQKKIRESLTELLNTKLNRAKMTINWYTQQIKERPTTLEQFVKFCQLLEESEVLKTKIKEEMSFIDQLVIPISDLNKRVNNNEQVQNTLGPFIQSFLTTQKDAIETKEQLYDSYIELLKKRADSINEKITKYMNIVQTTPRTISEVNVEQMCEDINQIKTTVDTFKPEVKECLHFQEVLKKEFSDFSELDTLLRYLDSILSLYNSIGVWNIIEKNYILTPFEVFTPEQFTPEFKLLSNDVKKLTKELSVNPGILVELMSNIEKIEPYMNLIVLTSKSNMQIRHWKKLFEELRIKIPYHPDIHLGELLQLEVFRNEELIKEITTIAANERNLEDNYKQIESKWNNIMLPIVPGQTKSEDSLLITDTTELVEEIKDTVETLREMCSHQFISGIKDDATKMRVALEQAAEILEAWQKFQTNWVMLSTLMTSEESNQALGQQKAKFVWVRRRWISIVKHAYNNLTLLVVCQFPMLLEITNENTFAIEQIIATLGSYINAKRLAIPRLFALGNYDILTLLTYNNVATFKRYVSKLFMNMASLDIPDDSISINDQIKRFKVGGLICKSGDAFVFRRPLTISGTMDSWMKQLIDIVHSTMFDTIYSYLVKSATVQITDWILTVPSHIAYVILNILFAREVDECISAYESNIRSFQSYETRLKNTFNSLLTLIDTPLNNNEVRKTSNAITIIMNQIDIVHQFTEAKLTKYNWKLTPKIVLNEQTRKCLVSYGDKTEPFGEEIWGDMRPFILTPQMQKTVISILNTNLPNIIGSPETGRKSLIKHMASHFGRFVASFPALDSLNSSVIASILAGVAASGSWAIINNANINKKDALMTLNDCFYQYNECYMNQADKITLGQTQCKFDLSSRLFLTTTPTKRNNIPQQLKSVMKNIAFATPEKRIITEMKLAANGFKSSKNLSAKTTQLASIIVDTFSSTLKSTKVLHHLYNVLDVAIAYFQETKSPSFRNVYQTKTENEEFIIAHSMYIYFSSLIEDPQLDSLYEIIYSIFQLDDTFEMFRARLTSTSIFKRDSVLDTLASHINKLVEGYGNAENLARQALNLYIQLSRHNIVVVHGAPGSGKSTVIRVLKEAINEITSSKNYSDNNKTKKLIPMMQYRVFHSSGTSREILGDWECQDGKSPFWKVGSLDVILQNIKKQNTKAHRAIIFDGFATDKVMRELSSIASDMNSFTNSLDTISFRNNGKLSFIIETESVNSLMPSYIPFCGFVYVRGTQDNRMDTCELVNTEAIINKVFPDASNDICKYFEEIVPPTIKYIYHTPNVLSNYENNRKVNGANLIMSEYIPEMTLKVFKGFIDSGDVSLGNNNSLKNGMCYAAFQTFSGILEPSQIQQFDLWLRSTYNITGLPKVTKGLCPQIFSDIYNDCTLQTHRIVKNEFKIINIEQLEKSLIKNDAAVPDNIHNVVITSPEMCVAGNTLDIALTNQIPAIILGGNEKGNFLRDFFKDRVKYTPIFIPGTQAASIEGIRNIITTNTNIFKTFTDRKENYVLVFEDMDSHSTVISEFIRMIIETKSLPKTTSFDINTYETINLNNFRIICTTDSYSDLSPRFLRYFMPVLLGDQNIVSVKYSLAKMLEAIGFSDDFVERITNLIYATQMQVSSFPRTLHKILNIVDGLSQMKEKVTQSKQQLRFALHIFLADLKTFFFDESPNEWDLFKVLFSTQFDDNDTLEDFDKKESYFHINLERPKFGAPFIQGQMEQLENVREELRLYLQVYNNVSPEKLDLKLSTPVIRRCMRLRRALMVPGGAAILYGKEGSGRFSLAKFLSQMLQYDFVHIVHDYYNPLSMDYLKAILRDVCSNCALMDKKCCIFIRQKDREVAKTTRFIIEFMKHCCFSILFDLEKHEEMLSKFSGRNVTKPDHYNAAYNKLCTQLSSNIHLIISTDYNIDEIEKIDIPSFNFTIESWDEINEVVYYCIHEREKGKELEPYIRSLATTVSKMHSEFSSIAGYSHINQVYDFVDLLCDYANSDYAKLVDKSSNLLTALNFFGALNEESKRLNKEFDKVSPNLENIASDCDVLKVSYTSKKESIIERRKELDEENTKMVKKLEKIREECAALEESQRRALKNVRELRDVVRRLPDDDISTFRLSLSEPVPSMKTLLEVLCCMLEIPVSFEREGCALANDPKFITTITTRIDHMKIDPVVLSHVEPYFQRSDFTAEVMNEQQPSMQAIFEWLVAVREFAINENTLTKLKVTLSNTEFEFKDALEMSNAERQQLIIQEEELKNEDKVLRASYESKKLIESQYDTIKSRREVVDAILSGIEDFVNEWAEESSSIVVSRELIIGTSLLISSYAAYCSRLNEDNRFKIIDKTIEIIKESGFTVPNSDPLTVINDRLLFDTTTDDEIFNPAENIVYDASFDIYLSKSLLRVPLILDIDGLAIQYIRKINKQKNVKIISVHSLQLESTIQNSLKQGATLVITDFDELHPIILSLLAYIRSRTECQKGIKIGSKTVQISPEFSLVLISNHRSANMIPDFLASRVSVIDMSDSSYRACTTMLKNEIINSYVPDLLPSVLAVRRYLIEANVNFKLRETDLLMTISDINKKRIDEPEYDYLEDKSVVTDILRAKSQLFEANANIKLNKKLTESAQEKVDSFNSVTTKVSLIWKAISRYLPRINKNYIFSYVQFLKVVSSSLQLPGFGQGMIKIEQAKQIIYALRMQIITWIAPSLSKRDTLILLFIIAFLDKSSNGEVKESDLDVILRHLKEEKNSSFDFKSTDLGLGEALDHLKFTNVTNVFTYVDKLVFQMYGADYHRFFKQFEVDDILSSNAAMPCIISTDGGDPAPLIEMFIAQRTRGDNFVSYSLHDNQKQLEELMKTIEIATKKGQRVLLNYNCYSETILSFLSDVYAMIRSTSLHTAFKLIICMQKDTQLTSSLLNNSVRIFYDKFPSIKSNTIQSFQQLTPIIRTATNSSAAKKIVYGISLLNSIISFRRFIEPIGLDQNFDVPITEVENLVKLIISLTDSTSNIQIRTIRDYMIDTIYGSSVIDVFDRRKIRSIVLNIFGQDFMNEKYSFCETTDDIFNIPTGVSLPGYSQAAGKLPDFPLTDCLNVNSSSWGPIRNWQFSRWIISGLELLLPKIPKQLESEYSIRFNSYMMSIPDFIGTGSKQKFISPMQIVMRGEVDEFNSLIEEIKVAFKEDPTSREIVSFVQGTVPDRWRNRIKFETSSSSQSFISYLGEKRDFLLKWLKDLKLETVDLRIVSNVKGLLQSFFIETIKSKGLSGNSLALEFHPLKDKEKAPNGALELINLSLVAGHWSEDNQKLEVNRNARAVEPFPRVSVTVGKPVNSSKFYMCPMLRTLCISDLSRSESVSYTDGHPDNHIWYIPLACEQQQSFIVSNSTCIVCSLPEQMEF